MNSKSEYITCKHCGNEIPSTSLFCMFCGNQLVKKIEPKEKREVKVPEPKQLPSGSWFIRLRLTEGTFCITKPTYAECKAEAIAMKSRVKTPENKPKKILLETLLQKYIDDNSTVLSPSTIRCYDSMKRNHFKEVIKEDINKIDWQAVINREAKENKPKTVKNLWRFVSVALRANNYPVPKINLPKGKSRTALFLDYQQIQVFLKAIRGKSCERVCLLALHSLRISEIRALNPDSIQNGYILVRGAVVPNKDNKYVFKETNKTEGSTRDVPVMIPRLLEIWPKEGEQLKFQGLSPMRKQIKSICRENDLPDITIHCLRHSFASLAYHLGWNMMTTCQVGGWSTTDCVQRIYTHLSKLDKNLDIQKMKDYYTSENENLVVSANQTDYIVFRNRSDKSNSEEMKAAQNDKNTRCKNAS